MSMQNTTPMSPQASSAAGIGFGTLVMGVVAAALLAPILWVLAFGAIALFPSSGGNPETIQGRLHPDTIPPDAQKHEDRAHDAEKSLPRVEPARQ